MGKVLHIGAAVDAARQAPAPTRPAGLTVRPARGPVRYSASLVPAGLPPSVETAALLLCNQEARPARQMSSNELGEQLSDVVALVPFLLGHSKSLLVDDDLYVMTLAVCEMVQRDFPALTVPEIGTALRRGCAGEWKKPDEILLASLPVIRSWLKAYSEGTRARAVQALQQADLQQQLLSRPLPDLQAGYPALVAALAGQPTLPQLIDPGGVLYAWLKKIGAFRGFGNPRRVMIQASLQHTSGRHLSPAQALFRAAMRYGWPAGYDLTPLVLRTCQQRTLYGWLRYHRARRTDLLTWLQQLAAAAPTE